MSKGIIFNGINAINGDYLLPELGAAEVARIARGEVLEPDHLRDLKYRHAQRIEAVMGVREGIDPTDLAESGWGILFAHEDADKVNAIKEALSELLDWRQRQAGDLFREFIGQAAYRSDESKNGFLARHGAAPGPVNPLKVPYYLLIVASPKAIPFRFQYQLAVQYAVGRIHFDTLGEYANYARSVVTAEKQSKPIRRVTFFGVENTGDAATHQSATYLVEPLAKEIAPSTPDWSVQLIRGSESTKETLSALLHKPERPALLFTASHGIGFPLGHPQQRSQQGALLCQNWPGPLEWPKGSPIPHEHYFSGDDISDDTDLSGMITFHFACYGAGTPQQDDFAHRAFQQRVDIASHPFIARLPQRLLGLPKGGAMAVIGHVERAWGYSFLWENADPQLSTFASTLARLMAGKPVGHALEFFSERYAELSTMLSAELEDVKFGKKVDDLELAQLWTANNDARSYVIIGDPAVRLAT